MEAPGGIVDAYSHADHQVRSLTVAEEKLWRKLGLGRHVLDRCRKRRGRRVDAHFGLLPSSNSFELTFGDEHVDVRVGRVGDFDRRRSDCGELADLRCDVDDLAGITSAKRMSS